MTAFDKAWGITKALLCPVCNSGEIRRLNFDDIDLYCDNCDTSWGVNYIGGMPTGRGKQARSKIDSHREEWGGSE